MLLDELEAKPRVTMPELRRILEREAGRPGFGRQLAEAVASGSAQLERNGAWLLRHWLAEGGRLTSGEWEVVLDALRGVHDWVARLELCQAWDEQPELMDAAPGEIADFLRGGLADKNPFVRAWAGTAFHRLGCRHADFRAEAAHALRRLRRDPAKSVQARLRRLQ